VAVISGTVSAGRNSLVYFCYIHRESGSAPHFEVLPETSHVGAMEHAAQMMAQRADAIRAEIWEGDRLVFSLPRSATPRDPPGQVAAP
jgi:hypothetical protein